MTARRRRRRAAVGPAADQRNDDRMAPNKCKRPIFELVVSISCVHFIRFITRIRNALYVYEYNAFSVPCVNEKNYY